MAHSDAFVRFAQSVMGPIRGRAQLESYDLSALYDVTDPIERQACELMLIRKLENRDDDPRLVGGLLRIGTPRALSALRDALGRYTNGTWTRVVLARTLYERDQSLPALLALLEIARKSYDAEVRAQASAALAKIPGPALDASLVRSWRDESDETARHAIRIALFERLGIGAVSPPFDAATQALLEQLATAEESAWPKLLSKLRRTAKRA